MKESKYEELLFLCTIGEICESNSTVKLNETDFDEYICFKPGNYISSKKALCVTTNKDERDCIIETRLTSFQKKLGLDDVVINGSGRIRLKSFALGYLVGNKKLTEAAYQNILSNFQVLVELEVLTLKEAKKLFLQFEEYVSECQKAYDKQTSEDL